MERLEPITPAARGQVKAEPTEVLTASRAKEESWLETMHLLDKDKLDPTEYVSWVGYHASKQPLEIRPVCPIALMPLFTEQAHSIAMILHSMVVVQKAIQHFNPGQVRSQSLQWTSLCTP